MREIIQTNQFKRDYKKIAASNKYSLNNFIQIIDLLTEDKVLPVKYRDHRLMGEWEGCRECHIKPNWLLIYRKEEKKLVLIRTGSHSDLF